MTTMSNPRYAIRYGGKLYQMSYLFPAEIAALRAHRNGQFQELSVLEWIRDQGRSGTYFDAGAHVGNHSLFFHAHCPSTHVISVEASPPIFKLLEENMDWNITNFAKAIYLHHCAVWNEPGEVFIGEPPRNNAALTKVVKNGGTKVVARTIDDLAEDHNVVVLKLDVEDVEEEALRGATRVLKGKPIVIIERHTKEQLDYSDKFLASFGLERVQDWKGIHTFGYK